MDQEKEPVEVVKEVIELLSTFRDIMRWNRETMDVDKIQERRCCGDERWLFRERWEKLFDVKHERFDLSHMLELYNVLHPQRARPVGAHELYRHAKALSPGSGMASSRRRSAYQS